MITAAWKDLALISLQIFSTERRKYYADKIYDLEVKQEEALGKVFPDYTDSEVYEIRRELKIEVDRFQKAFNTDLAETLKGLIGK